MNETCVWTEAYEGNGPWSSACGLEWDLLEGTPKDNRMNFCPSCGKPLEEKRYVEEVGDDAP